jgi:hypothetical protein
MRVDVELLFDLLERRGIISVLVRPYFREE